MSHKATFIRSYKDFIGKPTSSILVSVLVKRLANPFKKLIILNYWLFL